MRKLIFNLLIILFSFNHLLAQVDKHQEYEEKYENIWLKRMPKYTKVQFAGSIGIVSFGPGWIYAKNHCETDILFGFIPPNSNLPLMVTLTLKQNYQPFQIPLRQKFIFEPLSCGIYLNSTLHRDFWLFSPSRYPEKYYGFTTKLRIHAFVGQRIALKLNKLHSITFFYELSTCELYLINAFENKSLRPRDYLSLSFGLKLQHI